MNHDYPEVHKESGPPADLDGQVLSRVGLVGPHGLPLIACHHKEYSTQ